MKNSSEILNLGQDEYYFHEIRQIDCPSKEMWILHFGTEGVLFTVLGVWFVLVIIYIQPFVLCCVTHWYIFYIYSWIVLVLFPWLYFSHPSIIICVLLYRFTFILIFHIIHLHRGLWFEFLIFFLIILLCFYHFCPFGDLSYCNVVAVSTFDSTCRGTKHFWWSGSVS